MHGSLLATVDGSSHSRKALEVAHLLASAGEARLYLLNVAELPPARDGDALGRAVGASALHAWRGDAAHGLWRVH